MVYKDAYDEAVALPHAREMDLTGKPMTGMVFVAEQGTRDPDALRGWITRALALAATSPAR